MCSINNDAAERVPFAGDPGGERRGGHASRQHHRVGSNNAAISEAHTVRCQSLHRGAEPELDTGRCQRRLDHRSWPGSELRPDHLRPVEQHDAQPLGRAIAAVRHQPVAQLECQLDAGKASADDGDGRRRHVTHDLAQALVEGDRLGLGINRERRLGATHRRPTHAAASRDD